MSGSESDRRGPRESRHDPGDARDAESADSADSVEAAGRAAPAGNTSVRHDQATAHDIARVTDAVGQLQSQLDRMAQDLSNMQAQVSQAGIDAEEAITGALEDILTRLDRGVESTNNEKQERALARLQEQVDELVARSGRDRDNSGREDEVGPVLGRLEEAVSGMAAKADLDQDIVDALTRIETAISGLGEKGRYEGRSVLVRLDQLLEAVQATLAPSGPSSAGTGDRDQLIDKLEGLAKQVEAVGRRVALRARPEPVALDDATVSAVGEAVTDALATALTNRSGQSPNPRTAGAAPPQNWSAANEQAVHSYGNPKDSSDEHGDDRHDDRP